MSGAILTGLNRRSVSGEDGAEDDQPLLDHHPDVVVEEAGGHRDHLSVVLDQSIDKLHFPDEPLKTLLSFLFLCSCMVLTTMALVATNQRVPDMAPLPDLVLDNVEMVEVGLRVSEMFMLTSILISLFVAILHTHRLIVFRRVFFLTGMLYLYRSLTMQLTVLPKPDPDWTCPKYSGSLDTRAVVSSVFNIVTGGGISLGDQQPYCGDYIFSGHTMVLVTCYLVIKECQWKVDM